MSSIWNPLIYCLTVSNRALKEWIFTCFSIGGRSTVVSARSHCTHRELNRACTVLKMATSCDSLNSYAVTITGKCGVEIIFSRVSCLDLNSDFNKNFNKFASEQNVELLSVQVSVGPNGPWVTVDSAESMTVLAALSFRHILYWCTKSAPVATCTAGVSAFQVLMASAKEKRTPGRKEQRTNKHKMFNDICSLFDDAGLGFSKIIVDSEGSHVVQVGLRLYN